MSFVETILPKQAHNDFRGGRVPFYGFLLLLLPVTFRSMVHFLKDDPSRGSPWVFNITPIPGRCAGTQLVCPIPMSYPPYQLGSGSTSEYRRYAKSLLGARDEAHERRSTLRQEGDIRV